MNKIWFPPPLYHHQPQSRVTRLIPNFDGGAFLKHHGDEVLVNNILQTLHRADIGGVGHLLDEDTHVHVCEDHAVHIPQQHHLDTDVT